MEGLIDVDTIYISSWLVTDLEPVVQFGSAGYGKRINHSCYFLFHVVNGHWNYRAWLSHYCKLQ